MSGSRRRALYRHADLRYIPCEPMVEERPDRHANDLLHKVEVAVYTVLAVLLGITALATLVSAGHLLWNSLSHWTIATETLRVLDQLLIVLMLVEILHTVRISIRSHLVLATEPFLVVGVIASIRRILVISLQMAALTKEGKWPIDGASISRFDAGAWLTRGTGSGIGILYFSITALWSRTARHPRQHVKYVPAGMSGTSDGLRSRMSSCV